MFLRKLLKEKCDTRLAGVAFLFLFVVFGGGGSHQPLSGGIIEVVAVLWLTFYGVRSLVRRRALALPVALRIALGVVALLFVLQLTPVPYSWWSSLPQRDSAAQALAWSGLGTPWHALSLDPSATLANLFFLLPAGAVLVWACDVEVRDCRLLARAVVAAGLVSCALAVLQIASPGDGFLWATDTLNIGSGIFANPNHQGDLLNIAILLCGWLAGDQREHHRTQPVSIGRLPLPDRHHLVLLLVPVFAVMTFAAGARATVVLCPFAILLALAIAGGWTWTYRGAVIGLALLAPILAVVFYSDVGLLPFQAEIGGDHEFRIASIGDVFYLIQSYLPLGSGFGTFDPVFRRAESLDLLEITYFNHAHNDYFELLIEGGLLAIGTVAAAIGWLLFRAIRVETSSDSRVRDLQRVAAAALAILLIHSIVDYPLRTYTLSVLFAMMAALLCRHDIAGRIKSRQRVS